MEARIMREVIVAGLVVLALAGCQQNPEDKIKEGLVKYSYLYDPSSAMLRDVRDVGGDSYCLELNAKNKLGAYSGWRKVYLTYEPGKNNFNMILEPVKGGSDDKEIDQLERSTLNIICGYHL